MLVLIFYPALVSVGTYLVYRIGMLVEAAYNPAVSLLVFIGLWLSVLVIAWPITLRLAGRFSSEER